MRSVAHRLWARGEWTPGGTGVLWPTIFQLALVEALLFRALGYLFGDRAGSALGSVEQSAPLWVWASGLIAAAVLSTWGIARHQFAPQVLGHGLAAALYVGLGAGALDAMIVRQTWETLGAANGLIVLGGIFHGGYAVATQGKRRRLEIAGELAAHG